MAAVANNPEFAKKVGIPQSVGKEYEREDKKMSNCGSKRMMGGGKVGMHKMPGKKHKMAGGGTVSKGSMSREAEAAMDQYRQDREARKYRTREDRVGLEEVPWREVFPSESVQTMRRQQEELDARRADMPKMKKGGKVRGCGKAQRGMRKCKMVKMKGA